MNAFFGTSIDITARTLHLTSRLTTAGTVGSRAILLSFLFSRRYSSRDSSLFVTSWFTKKKKKRYVASIESRKEI